MKSGPKPTRMNSGKSVSAISRARLGVLLLLSAATAFAATGCGMLSPLEEGSSTGGAPRDLGYESNPANYTYGAAITPNKPVTAKPVDQFSVTPALPAGLVLDPATGIISGTPTT